MREESPGQRKLTEKEISRLKKKANWVRRQVLEMAIQAGAGHIAPSFSCIEILVALYCGGVLRINPRNPNSVNRDRFILSKGHAAAALYAVLAGCGFFPLSELMTFTRQKSRLGAHPTEDIPGVEASTGSLGHGLSIGAGLALAAKMDNKNYISVVLLGDGECHEGSVWEAAMFAAHHRLNNLVAIIDHNRLSAIGCLKKYLSIEPLNKKWQSFGWRVVTVNGHSLSALLGVFNKLHSRPSNKPSLVIALTTKGKGISFMENKTIWQYRIPAGRELEAARKELS